MGTSVLASATKHQRDIRPPGKRDKEIREAVERVYQKYGTNLTAFYRDARRESQKESEKRER